MTYTQFGSCIQCGAPKYMPSTWMGLYPPIPQSSCQCDNINNVNNVWNRDAIHYNDAQYKKLMIEVSEQFKQLSPKLSERSISFNKAVELLHDGKDVYIKAPFDEGCGIVRADVDNCDHLLNYLYLHMAETRHWNIFEVIPEDGRST